MSGHTPRPWSVMNTKDDECLMGFGIADAKDWFSKPGPWYSVWLQIKPEDARLIAASPELLASLIKLTDRIDYYASLKADDTPNIEDWAYTLASGDMADARAAIAKATGGDQ